MLHYIYYYSKPGRLYLKIPFALKFHNLLNIISENRFHFEFQAVTTLLRSGRAAYDPTPSRPIHHNPYLSLYNSFVRPKSLLYLSVSKLWRMHQTRMCHPTF